jgi:hypothetical protein
VVIDAYRRQLQRNYLELVNTKINGPGMAIPMRLPEGFPVAMFASSGDEKVLYRAELRSLNSSIGSALAKASDRETRAHLDGARDRIATILDPKFAAAQPGASSLRIFADEWADQWGDRWSGQPPLPYWDDSQEGSQFNNAPWEEMENCWPDYAIKP